MLQGVYTMLDVQSKRNEEVDQKSNPPQQPREAAVFWHHALYVLDSGNVIPVQISGILLGPTNSGKWSPQLSDLCKIYHYRDAVCRIHHDGLEWPSTSLSITCASLQRIRSRRQ
jgi:hypothetical protein